MSSYFRPAMALTLAVLCAAALMLMSATQVTAGGKPKGAKPTNPQEIVKLYAGKTSNWSRGGHAHWGAGGKFRGVNKDGNWIGTGKWYVTSRSRLCQEATWTGMKDNKRASETGKWCWEFVTAPDGVVWERYLPEQTDWYRHNREKQVNGDTQARKYKSIQRSLGL